MGDFENLGTDTERDIKNGVNNAQTAKNDVDYLKKAIQKNQDRKKEKEQTADTKKGGSDKKSSGKNDSSPSGKNGASDNKTDAPFSSDKEKGRQSPNQNNSFQPNSSDAADSPLSLNGKAKGRASSGVHGTTKGGANAGGAAAGGEAAATAASAGGTAAGTAAKAAAGAGVAKAAAAATAAFASLPGLLIGIIIALIVGGMLLIGAFFLSWPASIFNEASDIKHDNRDTQLTAITGTGAYGTAETSEQLEDVFNVIRKSVLSIVTSGYTSGSSASTSSTTIVNTSIDQNGNIDYTTDTSFTRIVDSGSPLPEDYQPAARKNIDVPSGYFVKELQVNAADAYSQMTRDAQEAGCTLLAVSGFRSYTTQNSLGNSSFIAGAGRSEHQTGLAVDITNGDMVGGGPDGDGLYEAFDQTKEYSWLMEHAADYGFIQSMPKDTPGFEYEPWHWRYVGSASLARSFMAAQNAGTIKTLRDFSATGTTIVPTVENNGVDIYAEGNWDALYVVSAWDTSKTQYEEATEEGKSMLAEMTDFLGNMLKNLTAGYDAQVTTGQWVEKTYPIYEKVEVTEYKDGKIQTGTYYQYVRDEIVKQNSVTYMTYKEETYVSIIDYDGDTNVSMKYNPQNSTVTSEDGKKVYRTKDEKLYVPDSKKTISPELVQETETKTVRSIKTKSSVMTALGLNPSDDYAGFSGGSSNGKGTNSEYVEYLRTSTLETLDIKDDSETSSTSGSYSGGDWIWPIPSHNTPEARAAGITSKYGYRIPTNGTTYHPAIDIGAGVSTDTDVVAMRDGTVVFADSNGAYGNSVHIQHPGTTITTKYNHLYSYCVSVGQEVKQGEVIAKVGGTGGYPVHLDFQFSDSTVNDDTYGTHVNPLLFFTKSYIAGTSSITNDNPDGDYEYIEGLAAETSFNVNDPDFKAVAATILHEAGVTNTESVRAVASCIYNRMKSSSFPNTAFEVVSASGQFESYYGGRYLAYVDNLAAYSEQVNVIVEVLNGNGVSHDYLYFKSKDSLDPDAEGNEQIPYGSGNIYHR